ncbi:hypothetical protein EHS25_005739 [Saitozyma podzolica]|uniref:Uncharacterized protein n=1 Tax=Saitozyma podzolica TaxID=1890683 RepID=A0A427XVY3_9TREE|nr:hypothetical protein EHS25_005739 [Saitozyma podzolica]
MAQGQARYTSLPEHDHNPSRLVNKYLDSVAASTAKVFASWKRVMIRGTYNLLLKRLSLCLLQARVRGFEL